MSNAYRSQNENLKFVKYIRGVILDTEAP